MYRLGCGADHGFTLFGGFSGSNRSGTTAGKQRAVARSRTFNLADQPEYTQSASHDCAAICSFDRASATCAQHHDTAADLDDYDDPDYDRSESQPDH